MTPKITTRMRCPECHSTRLTKDGTQISRRKRVQRYLCQNCYRRTIYPSGNGRKPH